MKINIKNHQALLIGLKGFLALSTVSCIFAADEVNKKVEELNQKLGTMREQLVQKEIELQHVLRTARPLVSKMSVQDINRLIDSKIEGLNSKIGDLHSKKTAVEKRHQKFMDDTRLTDDQRRAETKIAGAEIVPLTAESTKATAEIVKLEDSRSLVRDIESLRNEITTYQNDIAAYKSAIPKEKEKSKDSGSESKIAKGVSALSQKSAAISGSIAKMAVGVGTIAQYGLCRPRRFDVVRDDKGVQVVSEARN
jgi:hypothetical protein